MQYRTDNPPGKSYIRNGLVRGLAYVGFLYTLASSQRALAASYTLCLTYPDTELYDASIRDGHDWGEDKLRRGSSIPLPGMGATIVNVTGGVTAWSGQLNDWGCTTLFNSTSNLLNIYWSTFYTSVVSHRFAEELVA